jgi:light-regulated signal transduction histidine kinase (bacteriophytochrome)
MLPWANAGLDPREAPRHEWRRYLLAVVLIGAASALRLWPLEALGARLAWLTFYPAVAVAALFGGLYAGLFATLLSCFMVSFVLPASGHAMMNDAIDWLGMGVFFATAMVVAGVAEAMLRANARAKTAKEETEVANRELEAFSYSVAHDLRAPLRSIDGFSQAILEDSAETLDADSKVHLQRVRAAAQRMAVLIDDMLALSRVSRGELHGDRVDLSRVARTIGARLVEADKDHCTVQLIVEEGMIVHGDAQLLAVVMENLLANAWKFTSKHASARIEVGTLSRDGRPAIFVRDDGAGFDMAYAGKLFGAFQRLHAASEFPGTGIGLATVQRVIHRHLGRVWAEGLVDHGATFYFTLG